MNTIKFFQLFALFLIVFLQVHAIADEHKQNEIDGRVLYDDQVKKSLFDNDLKIGEYTVRKTIIKSRPETVTLAVSVKTFRDVPARIKMLAPRSSSVRFMGPNQGGVRFKNLIFPSKDDLLNLRTDIIESNTILAVFLTKILDGSEWINPGNVSMYDIVMENGWDKSGISKNFTISYTGDHVSDAIDIFRKYPLILQLPETLSVIKLYENNDYSEYEASLNDIIIEDQIKELEANGFFIRKALDLKKKVLLAFFDPECPYCAEMQSLIDTIILKNKSRILSQTIMLDEHEKIGYFFRIKTVPTFYIFWKADNKIQKEILIGKMEPEKFLAKIENTGAKK